MFMLTLWQTKVDIFLNAQSRCTHACTLTHPHPLYGPLDFVQDYPGEPVPEPIGILLKQETVSGSGIIWAICKYATRPRYNHGSTRPLSFLQARCPSCCPTNSVKAVSRLQMHRYKLIAVVVIVVSSSLV